MRASQERTAWDVTQSLHRVLAGLAEPDEGYPVDPIDGDLVYLRTAPDTAKAMRYSRTGQWIEYAVVRSGQFASDAPPYTNDVYLMDCGASCGKCKRCTEAL